MLKHWTVLVMATLFTLFAPAPVARADIFQWEYINPADPDLGKQQSTMLAPDGAGASAAPAANLSNRDLAQAYLIGAILPGANLTNTNLAGNEYYQSADLTGANLRQANLTNARFQSARQGGGEYYYANGANLTNADLSQANLTNANFSGEFVLYEDTGFVVPGADLTGVNLSGAQSLGASFAYALVAGANLTGADVRWADFGRSGITAAQIYSTANYQAHDLTGIGLWGNNWTGANFAGQNLAGARFDDSSLQDANLSQANLTNATLYGAGLSGANLTEAEVRGANFSRSGFGGTSITVAQLYSTASYLAHDLTGIGLGANYHLVGVNLAGQNLTNANFFEATLTGANLSGADARGASFEYATLTGANTSNLIQPDGHIAGLGLTAGASLVVRDYDGRPPGHPPTGPLPIVVEQHLAMDATGTLRLVFDADPWDSTISFAPGIPVALGGTLDLTFAPGVDVATQTGRTIDLFDWIGVTPTGAFTVSSPYTWNLTNLYTTGEVTLTAVPSLPGDFNLDGTVDAADYVVWRKFNSTTTTLPNDPNALPIDGDQYNTWRTNFGELGGAGSGASANATVPEPATMVLLMFAASCCCLRRGRDVEKVPSSR